MARVRTSLQVSAASLSDVLGDQDLTSVFNRLSKDSAARRAALKDPKGFLREEGIKLPRGIEASFEQQIPRWPTWPRGIRVICFVICRRYLRYWICFRICIPIVG